MSNVANRGNCLKVKPSRNDTSVAATYSSQDFANSRASDPLTAASCVALIPFTDGIFYSCCARAAESSGVDSLLKQMANQTTTPTTAKQQLSLLIMTTATASAKEA
jgi:hypothetical protein